jgi:hypothetical protein
MRQHPVLSCVLALALIAGLKGLHDVIAMASVSFVETIWQDSKIYAAAGRAMLNGINPYAEYFENKPPLVFLIMAASLWLTGNQFFAAIIYSISLLSFPVALAIAGWRSAEESMRRAWATIGLFLGMAIAGYVYQRCGAAMQTELVGAAAGTWFVTIIIGKWKEPFLQIAFAAIAAFIAMWIKEPFAVVIGACAILLFRSDWKSILRLGVLPGAIAGILGVILLFILGVQQAYVGIYLKFMMGTHIEYRGSPWVRGLHVEKMAVDLWNYSPFLLLSFLAIIGTVLAAFVLHARDKKEAALSIGIVAFVLYAVSFTVGLGGQYYPHHYVFALPLWAAFFAQAASCGWSPRRPSVVPGIVAALLSVALILAPSAMLRWHGPWMGGPPEQAFRNRAMLFDAMMDACEYDRYMPYGWELEDLWTYTRHTPYSSTFTSYRFGLSHTDEFFAQIYSDQLNETPLIVLLPGRVAELEQDTGGQIWNVFTDQPPECAATYAFKNPDGEALTLLFRKR